MEAKVKWHGRLSFTGTADSGFPVKLGTDPGVGGDNDGARPMELLALGLAGCTAMDVISILQKKRQSVTDFEVQVNATRAEEHPKIFTGALIEYFISGENLDEDAVVRAIELSVTRYCPANAMFSKIMPVAFQYHLFEAADDGGRTPIKSAEYVPVLNPIE